MIDFYTMSGSPFGWRVALALEHKSVPHRTKMLSPSKGETKAPEFLAINPNGRVPAIVHDGFALWESSAIVEYLDEVFPEPPLFPRDPRAAAIVRRLVREADADYGVPNEELVDEILFEKEPERDAKRIARARDALAKELARWDRVLEGREWLADALSAADFALYPMIALTLRMEKRFLPSLALDATIGPSMRAWMKRIESLPYYDKTYPPHWR
jgi:glutathione S-transferase